MWCIYVRLNGYLLMAGSRNNIIVRVGLDIYPFERAFACFALTWCIYWHNKCAFSCELYIKEWIYTFVILLQCCTYWLYYKILLHLSCLYTFFFSLFNQSPTRHTLKYYAIFWVIILHLIAIMCAIFYPSTHRTI